MQKQGLTTLALQKFKKSFWGVLSFWFIVFLAFISVFAYVLAPDDSQFANQMHLSIHSKQPGFTVEMLVVPNTLTNDQSFFNRVFFGVKNPTSQIPISTHTAESHQIKYVEYASEGLEGLEKTIDIPLDTEASLHPFVTQKNILFWYR